MDLSQKSNKTKLTKNITILLLVTILLTGGTLRFSYLSDSGFTQVDEYAFFREVRGANQLKYVFSNFPELIRAKKVIHHLTGAIKSIPAKRPGWRFVLFLWALLVGGETAHGLYMGAFFGVLTILGVYLVGRQLFGKVEALAASALLATSRSHVIASRRAMPYSPAVFFLVYAVYCYLRSRSHEPSSPYWIFLSGALCGFAISTHPNMTIYLLVFLMLELHLFVVLRRARQQYPIMRPLLFFPPVFSIILLWEMPHFIFHVYFALKGRIQLFSPYFGSLRAINNMPSNLWNTWEYYSSARPSQIPNLGVSFFPGYLFETEGIIFLMMVVVAFVYILYRWAKCWTRHEECLLLLWVAIPFSFYSLPLFYSTPNSFISIIPALTLALGYTFGQVSVSSPLKTRGFRHIPWIKWGLFALLLGIGLSNARILINTRWTYKPILEYIESHQLDRIIVNASTLHFAKSSDVIRDLPGFTLLNHEHDGALVPSQIGIKHKNPNWVAPRFWLGMEELKDWCREGKIDYFITSLADNFYFRLNELSSFLGPPIFSIPSPFRHKFYIMELQSNFTPYILGFYKSYVPSSGEPALQEEMLRDPYYKVIGIYDLRKVCNREQQ
jgi:4-amino-4-deoxy-L-arabinose transferase-like glycosyltransferase